MIDHITYWLIAAASWTMLVFGTFGLIVSFIGLFNTATKQAHYLGIAYGTLSLAAIAVALHFTL